MKTKTYNLQKYGKWRIIIGTIIIFISFILTFTNYSWPTIGTFNFPSWLMFVGIMLIIFGIKQHFWGKEIKYDERYQQIINYSSKLTFQAIIYLTLTLYVIGIIKKINIDLALFSSYILFFVIIVYKLAFWYYSKKY